MRRFRFHLGTLVILVLLLAVGFAALRQSNETWDSSVFNITLGVLLISILLTIHRTGKSRAFWLGFALFVSTYLGLSLFPSIQSRLITTKGLAFLDSKIPRSIPAGPTYFDYGSMDLFVVNKSQQNALFLNKADGKFVDVTAAAGSKPWLSNIFLGTSSTGAMGTTENFVRIGNSLIALIAAIFGGLFSRHLHVRNLARGSEPSEHPE